jgi:hypothetical protein
MMSELPPETLYRLIYFSHAAPPIVARLEIAVADISATALYFNRTNAVTGALLYCNGWFMQVLEGSAERVEKTYTHIEQDERHYDLRVLDRGVIDYREFSDWRMACMTLVPDDPLIARAVGQDGQGTFDPTTLSCEGAMALLHVAAQTYAVA